MRGVAYREKMNALVLKEKNMTRKAVSHKIREWKNHDETFSGIQVWEDWVNSSPVRESSPWFVTACTAAALTKPRIEMLKWVTQEIWELKSQELQKKEFQEWVMILGYAMKTRIEDKVIHNWLNEVGAIEVLKCRENDFFKWSVLDYAASKRPQLWREWVRSGPLGEDWFITQVRQSMEIRRSYIPFQEKEEWANEKRMVEAAIEKGYFEKECETLLEHEDKKVGQAVRRI